jgi:hypothetical protein
MLSARAFFLSLSAIAMASAAGIVSACDSDGTIVGGDSGSPDATQDVVTFDGPTSFDAPSTSKDSGASDAPTSDAAAFAFIELSEVPIGGGTFTAAFFATPIAPPPGCTIDAPDGGTCEVTVCPAKVPNDAGVVSLASAGALDVTGGAFGDAGVQVGADNLGSYLYNTTGPMFSPGDMLGVSGAGADVPAFATQTLVAPGAITVTSPVAVDGGAAIVVPTAQDLSVTWTGGTTGDHVIFTLNAFFTDGSSASTLCSWDASAGQGVVPSSTLAPLAGAAPQEPRSDAIWYQQAETTFSAGRWNVAMRADIHGGSLAQFQGADAGGD